MSKKKSHVCLPAINRHGFCLNPGRDANDVAQAPIDQVGRLYHALHGGWDKSQGLARVVPFATYSKLAKVSAKQFVERWNEYSGDTKVKLDDGSELTYEHPTITSAPDYVVVSGQCRSYTCLLIGVQIVYSVDKTEYKSLTELAFRQVADNSIKALAYPQFGIYVAGCDLLEERTISAAEFRRLFGLKVGTSQRLYALCTYSSTRNHRLSKADFDLLGKRELARAIGGSIGKESALSAEVLKVIRETYPGKKQWSPSGTPIGKAHCQAILSRLRAGASLASKSAIKPTRLREIADMWSDEYPTLATILRAVADGDESVFGAGSIRKKLFPKTKTKTTNK